MKHALLALLALALTAAVLVVALGRRGEPAGEAPAPTDGPEQRPLEPIREARAAELETERRAVGPAPVDALETETHEEDSAGGIPVLVVNPDGESVADVPVALLGRIDSLPEFEKTLAEARTDARGRALLVEGEDERETRTRMKELMDVEFRLSVAAQVPFPERPARQLGNDLRVTEPIRLVLPPSGSIRLHVSTPDGQPLPAGTAAFSRRPAGSDEAYERDSAWRGTVVDGVVGFAPLPLGQEFRFSAGGGDYRSGLAFVLGPAQAGQIVDLDLVLGPPLPAITGLLVGEDGVPLSGVSVSMTLFALERDAPAQADTEPTSGRRVQVDQTGRFRHVTYLEPEATQRVVLKVHEESRRTPSEVDRYARWEGAAQLSPGELFDVGTLVLRPHDRRRLLVAGYVRSEDGEPLHNMGVDVGYWNVDEGKWTQLAEDRVQVQRDGFFEIHTILDEVPEQFRVSAGARGCPGASVDASLGETGLELILARGGGLAGRFVTDDPMALPLLAVLIQGESFSRNPDIGLGYFRVDNLPPGTYSVIAEAHGTDWQFGGIEGVVVPRGGFADDPRLARIDLGDACRILRLTVLDPDGRPVSRRSVSVQDAARDGGSFRTNKSGELVALIPATAEELELSVSVDGLRLGAVWSATTGTTGSITLIERPR